MEKGPQNEENILCRLRRCRLNNKGLVEVTSLIEHVEKHGCGNKVEEDRVIEEIVRLLTSSGDGSDTEDIASSMGCVIWMTQLQLQQKLPFLTGPQFEQVLIWLGEKLKTDNMEVVSHICIALDGLCASHPMKASRCSVSISRDILKYLCWDSKVDVVINVMRCFDNMLSAVSVSDMPKGYMEVCAELGVGILRLFYCDDKPAVDRDVVPVFLTHSLQLANRVTSINVEFSSKYIAELLGLAKAHFHFGVGNVIPTILSPQKVYISQQALCDSAEEFEVNMNSETHRNNGGKTPKARKPRLSARSGDRNLNNSNMEIKNTLLSFEVKTSDSDVSETETGANHVLYERNKMAKIRLAAITLVGTLARTIERRLIYGYWHGLFPCGTGETADNLMYISQHDPNMRCRCAALQVCAQLLYGSRGFLHQAETNNKRCPTTFIPFSISLGLTILNIYSELTTILSTESSLPVLTQALKCLAVLVQATPFQKLEKGFVPGFVRHVRPLIYHRDVAVQVSALMVMEFLLSSSDAEAGIAEAVGLPQTSTARSANKINSLGDAELDIIDMEEFVESDNSDSDEVKATECVPNADDAENINQGIHSWLLLRVLHNLGKQDKAVPTSIRIESLQVLTAISSHFASLTSHMTEVCEVLKYAIENPLPDVRIYAARCIDTCAYQISRFVLDNVPSSSNETKKFSQFWPDIMPIVLNHIRRDREETGTVRIALCDALSNIGVVMFENCSHSLQIRLLSFLSGVSSDSTDDIVVRAAAVRALAVYALYPSLRGDFVFVENTADLTLRLVTDTNLLVRVKSFWSLGNISDALIGKSTNTNDSHERISDDLLFQMISASATACSDNDKVRCNAVRALGNLLRLLRDDHFRSEHSSKNWKQMFEKAVSKLTDCIRSSGNAKVKWNTCYAISNLLRNHTIFHDTDLNWQKTLYSALCHVIVYHSNFKVRINATAAILSISKRAHFGNYFEQFCCSILEAIEQSYNLDNFHEYNHRDNLQDQLCLALAHILNCATKDDWTMLNNRLYPHAETVVTTWKRVVLRMVPESAAPLLSCPVILLERGKVQDGLSFDEKNAINYLVETFTIIQ